MRMLAENKVVSGQLLRFGSTLAVLISMTWGFNATSVAGALAYGAALGALALLGRSVVGTEARARENAAIQLSNEASLP